MELHIPKELINIDVSVLCGKIKQDTKSTLFYIEINNPAFKSIIPVIKTNTKERLRLLAKYHLYNYYVKYNKGRACKKCKSFILGKAYIDICNECIKEKNK